MASWLGLALWWSLRAFGRFSLTRFGRMAIVSAVVLGTGISFANHAKQLDVFTVNVNQMKIGMRPSWMTPEIEREILNAPGMRRKFSIFQPNLAAHLADFYASYPWVSRVLEVRKQYPNQVVLQFELRRPVAKVAVGNAFYYIDREGARLSDKYYDLSATPDIPLILGAPQPVPAPGRRWEGNGIQAGLEVLAVLYAEGLDRDMGLTIVDISNLGGQVDIRKSEISLVRNLGAPDELVIEWGRSSAYSRFGELPVNDKVVNLRQLMRQFPGLKGLRTIKLQFSDPYWVAY